MLMGSKGCSMLVYPGAFNMTTGPLHWELLQRARYFPIVNLEAYTYNMYQSCR